MTSSDHGLRRLALAATLAGSMEVSALEICHCDKPPLTTVCTVACAIIPKPTGPIVVPTPAPQPPKINPFADKPAARVFDKSQVFERLPDARQGMSEKLKGKLPGGLGEKK